MQPGNPYHLIEAVGSCQVGSVWSAIDPQGRSLMVALLDPNVATDQRWREAFQEAANALVQAGEPGYLYADFASGSPGWRTRRRTASAPSGSSWRWAWTSSRCRRTGSGRWTTRRSSRRPS
ncbi:hypothetical protein ACFQ1L_12125 [Phytohabitans flavus]|uniref:hypothetical protein n=1 Tax=Phytohabitans flavus TaxID=1076124 RepID=UPI0036420E35